MSIWNKNTTKHHNYYVGLVPIWRQQPKYRRMGTNLVCVQLRFFVDFNLQFSWFWHEYDICLPGLWDVFFFKNKGNEQIGLFAKVTDRATSKQKISRRERIRCFLFRYSTFLQSVPFFFRSPEQNRLVKNNKTLYWYEQVAWTVTRSV